MGNTESSRKDLAPIFTAIADGYDAGFAVELYTQLAGTKSAALEVRKNCFMSPLSIATALAMAGTGAKGKTLDEIQDCLRCPKGEAMHQFFYQIKSAVLKGEIQEDGPVLAFVNGLWLERTLHTRRLFESVVKKSYGTEPTVADFRGKAEEERTIVNRWMSRITDGRIQDLLPPSSLDSDTKLFLANTLSFKGAWNEKFQPEDTIFEDFHLLDGSRVSVPFMTSLKAQYIERFEKYKVLKLPYFRGQDQRSFSMFFLLPDAKDGIVQEKLIDAKILRMQFSSIEKRKVGKFRLPKFRITTGYNMKGPLQSLGLITPFSEGADFSEMVEAPKAEESDRPPKSRELYLSDVFHKCSIEVNEEGTRASGASTANSAAAQETLVKDSSSIDFAADHPFLFFLQEEKTGLIVFIGRITNPSVSK